MTHTQSDSPSKKSAWGKGVWALYGGFVLFILSMVAYVSLVDFQLVEKDYYPKEVAYQQRIDSEERALALPVQPSIRTSGVPQSAQLQLPPEWAGDVTDGSILFMRPSDHHYDFSVDIKTDANGLQEIVSDKLIPGFWRVTVSWKLDGQDYVTRHELFVGAE